MSCASNISQPNISLNNFAACFKAVNNPDCVFYTPDDDIIYFNERYLKGELQVMFNELDATISTAEISKAIDELSNGKSAVSDRLINGFSSTERHLLFHIFIFFLIRFLNKVISLVLGRSEKLSLCTRRETSLMLIIIAVLPF